MSFFDVPAPPPEPDHEVAHIRPPWLGPPRGVLPGSSAQQVVIFKTDRVMLVANNFRVYPTGVMLSLRLALKESNEDLNGLPWELHGRLSRDPLSDDFLRLGILFDDGSKWTNLDGRMPHPIEEPDGPVVTGQGASGGGHSWEQEWWLWPLPPEGPLTFVASWPAYEAPESTAVIDGAELRRCAEDAEVIWPT